MRQNILGRTLTSSHRMHEMSIALDVCRIAEQRVGTAAAADLTSVAVEVGDDSGVEAASLEFCLDVLLRQRPFQKARPLILRVPGAVLRVAYLEIDDGSPND